MHLGNGLKGEKRLIMQTKTYPPIIMIHNIDSLPRIALAWKDGDVYNIL